MAPSPQPWRGSGSVLFRCSKPTAPKKTDEIPGRYLGASDGTAEQRASGPVPFRPAEPAPAFGASRSAPLRGTAAGG